MKDRDPSNASKGAFRNRVRNRLSAGGRWIRTLGPAIGTMVLAGPAPFTRGKDGSIFLHFDPGAARPIGRADAVQSQEYRTGAEGLARFTVRAIVMGSITAPSSEPTGSRVDQIDE